jgi:hypothetical protein
MIAEDMTSETSHTGTYWYMIMIKNRFFPTEFSARERVGREDGIVKD